MEFPGGLTVKDLALSLLWLRFLLAWVQFQAMELLHAIGMAKKKKKKREINIATFIKKVNDITTYNFF